MRYCGVALHGRTHSTRNRWNDARSSSLPVITRAHRETRDRRTPKMQCSRLRNQRGARSAAEVAEMTASVRRWCTWCAALVGQVRLSAPVRAQSENSPTIHVTRAAEPPRLEWFVNKANGTAHDRGTVVTDFLQQQPGDGTPVSESTAAFLSYDDAYLYVV